MCVSVSTLKEDLVKYNYLYDSADSVIEYLNGHIREGNISSGQAEYIYEWSSYILGFRREPITFSAEGKMIKIQMDEKEISLNMHISYPAKVESIVEQLANVLPPEEIETMRDGIPLYVVSNEKGMNGAVEILDPHTMDLIKETLGNQEYLAIPSSVHEFLIMPMDESGSFREMAAMIQEVNQTAVSKEEILSDHPYKIDPERHLFISADRDITVEKQMENKNIEQKQMDIMMQPNVHKRKIEQRGPRL